MGADGDSSAAATVRIRCSNGSNFSVQSALDSTVMAFKVALAGSCDMPAEQQRLIYKGRIMKDDQTLESYGVESDHTIHLVRSFASSVAASNISTDNLGASRTPNNTSGVTRGSNEGGVVGGGAALEGSLFSGLGADRMAGSGTSGLFGTGLPEFDQVQQQLLQNPNMLREIMDLPAFIQDLTSNPDLVRNLIMNSPQMRGIIERNPDLVQFLNDPSALRLALEAATNPELMREIMRYRDRAMRNIESSPEGFNMLRHMYETVQEPFLNATTMGGETRSDLESNPFTVLQGNQGSAQSGNRSLNPSTTSSTEPATVSTVPNTNPLPNPWSNTTGVTQPANTRSTTPASDTRAPNIARSGGLGLSELEQMLTEHSPLLNQVMQNPAMTQMMQNLLSDPQHANQVLSSHPNLLHPMESNTQVRDVMQNPEFLRQLASPDTMQQVQQSLQSQLGRQQLSQEQNQTVGGTGTPNNTGRELLMNMFGGLGIPSASVSAEEMYATQLSQLQEMGFFDVQANIRALSTTAGNVHAAVERLLGNLGH